MNPTVITSAQWDAIARLLLDLAAFASLLIVMALSLLMGRAVIPSLADSHGLPPALARIHPFLYLVALGALIGAAFFGKLALDLFVSVFSDIYPRFSI